MIPASASVWPEPMDPYDIVDYKIDCSSLLDIGDEVADFAVEVLTESELLGLTLGIDSYEPVLVGNTVTVWLSIDPAEQDNAAFVAGVNLPLEITVTSDSVPPRRRQRTVVVKVIQR